MQIMSELCEKNIQLLHEALSTAHKVTTSNI